MHGEVLVNGSPRQLDEFIASTGYVERGDLGFPFLTARECVRYRAGVRLGGMQTTEAQRREFIRQVRRVPAGRRERESGGWRSRRKFLVTARSNIPELPPP